MTINAQKTARVCRLVERIMQTVLHDVHDDDLVGSISVLTVEQGSSSSALVVKMGFESADWLADFAEVSVSLEKLKPRLTTEVARTLNRKRVPSFQFEVYPMGSGGASRRGGDDDAN